MCGRRFRSAGPAQRAAELCQPGRLCGRHGDGRGPEKSGEPTRESLIEGIESLHELDMGLGPQLRLNYSAKSHKGFEQVIPTIVRGGRAVPFTDWSIVVSK